MTLWDFAARQNRGDQLGGVNLTLRSGETAPLSSKLYRIAASMSSITAQLPYLLGAGQLSDKNRGRVSPFGFVMVSSSVILTIA